MFTGTGTIVYDPHRGGMKKRTSWWCVVNIDHGDELTRYYRWWVDKEITNKFGQDGYGLKPQSWWPHISVIRGEKPYPDKMELWKKYDRKKVQFTYDHVGNFKLGTNNKGEAPGLFFVVDVKCDQLTEIRKEFGLKYDWPMHITFGRTYDKQ